MAQQETIREFLVELGYNINTTEERRFNDALANTAKAAVALSAVLLGAVAAVTKMAQGLEDLYFASQRTQATAGNIQALGYAASQMGSGMEAARGSLEALARQMRSSPGYEGLIASLGVQTRVANGALRDTSDLLVDLGNRFRDMPTFQANAYASALGIDERTMLALRDGSFAKYMDEYRAALRQAGVDSDAAAKSSHNFMEELRRLGMWVDVLRQKVAEALTDRMAADFRRFRVAFAENIGRISDAITAAVRGIMFFSDIVGRLIVRTVEVLSQLYDWFNRLDPASKRAIEAFAGILAAWRLLNAGFLATPLGAILALSAGLLALYDDYETWKDGGDSLIDWEQWEKEILAARDGIKKIGDDLEGLLTRFENWSPKFNEASFRDIAWIVNILKKIDQGDYAGAWNEFSSGWGPSGNFLGLYPENERGAQAQPDNRSFWQRVAPRWMGGRMGPEDKQRLGQQAIDYFIAQGWSREQAAGIVANLEHESGFDHQVVGDNGNAYGLAQWHPDRQTEFARWAGKPITRATFEEQLAFVQYELTQGKERSAGDRLRGARTAAEAGGIVSRYYERPADADGQASARGASAGRWAGAPATAPRPIETENLLAMLRSANGSLSPEQLGRLQGNAGSLYNPSMPAGAGGGVTVTQETNITVNGSSDPQQVASAVGREQTRVNADLFRNVQGATR